MFRRYQRLFMNMHNIASPHNQSVQTEQQSYHEIPSFVSILLFLIQLNSTEYILFSSLLCAEYFVWFQPHNSSHCSLNRSTNKECCKVAENTLSLAKFPLSKCQCKQKVMCNGVVSTLNQKLALIKVLV